MMGKLANLALAILMILPLPLPGKSGNNLTLIQQSSASLFGDIGWKNGFSVNGTDNPARVVVIDGRKVYFGGTFPIAGNLVANNIAIWDGENWSTLGSGVNNGVLALAIDGRGNLYAGGWFTEAGGKPANHVARWNGQDWEALGDGIDGYVYSLAVDSSGSVYAGGMFATADGVEALNVARWDGTSWKALGSGISSSYPKTVQVNTLLIDRFGFVYVGGSFTHAGGVPAENIARWDGSEWLGLGSGITGPKPPVASVSALAADTRGNLYAGGRFNTAGGVPANNLARWDGETWSAVGEGAPSSGNQTILFVQSIIADGSMIYISGVMDAGDGLARRFIAQWNGVSWEDLNGGIWRDRSYVSINSISMDRDGRIYAAGAFWMAGSRCANNVAVWDGSQWSGLGANTGVTGDIQAMATDPKGGYYLAGGFYCAGNQSVNHIVHWDGALGWSALGDGLSADSYEAYAMKLVVDHQGNLYAAGYFTQAGSTPVSNIARWDGTSWTPLGGGLKSKVTSLALDSQDRLYAGGYFSIEGSDPPQYTTISRWDGNQWEAVGLGFDNPVLALAVDSQDRLIAGGMFDTAGGMTAHHLARWDGQTWTALATEDVGETRTLLVDGDTIYGGSNNIWKVHDGVYEILGGGVSYSLNPYSTTPIYALTLDQHGRLIIGGGFDHAGQTNANAIARWDENHWESLGSGVKYGVPYALLSDRFGNLFVGGSFALAGGKESPYFAVWSEQVMHWLPLITSQ